MFFPFQHGGGEFKVASGCWIEGKIVVTTYNLDILQMGDADMPVFLEIVDNHPGGYERHEVIRETKNIR